ncbi:ATP-binding cassette domain-containing protein [Anderseniella sp. Alg231-50]|uniref:ATP-binding cassette domain-containing protein n=1 Tax=Anderseniella sp. Alg231-50 TaxID=1922226 RepID=UPI000D5513D9
MSMVLHTLDVSRRFREVEALKGVSLDVASGEKVALLGHNGAGKTTLFRVILGFLRTHGGRVSINGQAPGSRLARRDVSYLPESVAFPKMLTGREIVTFYAKLKSADAGQVESALEKVDLADAADRPCDGYSKGMRQRLGLAQAIVGNPKLMLLDEPTSGLDPISRQRFYSLIGEIAGKGTAVLLSSHGLSELELKTDRVAILRKGELVANGSLAELQRSANLPIRIRVRSNSADVESVHKQFGGERINGESVEFDCARPDKMDRLSAISKLGAAVNDVEISSPSLDEVYRYFSREGDEGGDEA